MQGHLISWLCVCLHCWSSKLYVGAFISMLGHPLSCLGVCFHGWRSKKAAGCLSYSLAICSRCWVLTANTLSFYQRNWFEKRRILDRLLFHFDKRNWLFSWPFISMLWRPTSWLGVCFHGWWYKNAVGCLNYSLAICFTCWVLDSSAGHSFNNKRLRVANCLILYFILMFLL